MKSNIKNILCGIKRWISFSIVFALSLTVTVFAAAEPTWKVGNKWLNFNGQNVGVGISPESRFHIDGDLRLSNKTSGGTSARIVYNKNGLYIKGGASAGATDGNLGIFVGDDGNVGVGTSNPLDPFHVKLGADRNFAIGGPETGGIKEGVVINTYNDTRNANVPVEIRASTTVLGLAGNVGIGVTDPGAWKLDIAGFIRQTSNADFQGIHVQNSNANAKGVQSVGILQNDDGSFHIHRWGKADILYSNADANITTLGSVGNVGIGTTTPDSKLHVAGGTTTLQGASNGNPQNWQTHFGNQFGSNYIRGTTVFDAGFVGIGTSNPHDPFHIKDGIDRNLAISAANHNVSGGLSEGMIIQSYNDTRNANTPLEIRASTTVLGLTGNVGIGTTNPEVELHVKSNQGNADIAVESTDGTKWTMSAENGSREFHINRQITGIEPSFRLSYATGNVGIKKSPDTSYSLDILGSARANSGVFQNSDMRLKQNIQPINSALEKVQNLKGVTFDWKKDGKKSIGFIAQELEKVLPELVSTDSSKEHIKSVEYGNISAVLVEAVKEMKKDYDSKIESQQKEIEMLKEEINMLKKL